MQSSLTMKFETGFIGSSVIEVFNDERKANIVPLCVDLMGKSLSHTELVTERESSNYVNYMVRLRFVDVGNMR